MASNSKKIVYPKCFRDGSYKKEILPTLDSFEKFAKFTRKILNKVVKMKTPDAYDIINKISKDVQKKHPTIDCYAMYSFMVALHDNMYKMEEEQEEEEKEQEMEGSVSEDTDTSRTTSRSASRSSNSSLSSSDSEEQSDSYSESDESSEEEEEEEGVKG